MVEQRDAMLAFSTTLVRERRRLRDIADVLSRYGLAGLARRVEQAQQATSSRASELLVSRADPTLASWTTGQRARGALTELGSTWIKIGQMLSVRPDIVGNEVAEELTKLQSAVPADAAGHAERLISSELGAPVSELFARFDSQAMASGSVAQVHSATLTDGTDVVVKVLHAGVEGRVESDMELITALARFVESTDPELARYRPAALAAEFTTMMRAAVDLSHEGSNLQKFRTNFEDEPDVNIPVPYPELSSRRVLTQQRLTGTTLEDAGSVERSGWQVDTLVRRTTEVYLEMMFRDGVFHADPHPGNFLLEPGRIGILDFGDVGTLSPLTQTRLKSFLLAVTGGNLDDLTDAMLELTDASIDADRQRLTAEISTNMAPYLQNQAGDLDVSAILNSVIKVIHDSGLQLPSEVAMLFRVLVLLDGLGRRVGAHSNFVDLVAPYLEESASSRLDPRQLGQKLARQMRQWDALAASLPSDLSAVLARLRRGDVTVEVNLHDPDRRLDDLVDGLVVGTLALSAAQLLSQQTRPLIRSVSLPGAATALAGALTYRRLRGRRGNHSGARTLAVELVRSAMGRAHPTSDAPASK